MALSLEDLRVFRSVAATGSFGRAAARLRLSQPAVSERMARLERDLGRRLFLRGGRGVPLTTARPRPAAAAPPPPAGAGGGGAPPRGRAPPPPPPPRRPRSPPAETVANLARRGSHAGLLTRSTVAHDLAAGTLVELPVTDLPRW